MYPKPPSCTIACHQTSPGSTLVLKCIIGGVSSHVGLHRLVFVNPSLPQPSQRPKPTAGALPRCASPATSAGSAVLINAGDLDGDDTNFEQVEDGEFAINCGCEVTPSPVVTSAPTEVKPKGTTGLNAVAPSCLMSVVVTAGAAVAMAAELAFGW